MPMILLIASASVLALSNEEVNQNGIHGWVTLLQGVVLFGIYAFVHFKKANQLLLTALIGYSSTLLIELVLFGMPNDLYKAYYEKNVSLPSHAGYRSKIKGGGALMIGYLFPIMYLIVKLFFILIPLNIYLRFKKYDALTEYVKTDLEDLLNSTH